MATARRGDECGMADRTPSEYQRQQEPDVETVPLGDDDETIAQQNVGRTNMEGGGEWPDPDTPPQPPAPGSG